MYLLNIYIFIIYKNRIPLVKQYDILPGIVAAFNGQKVQLQGNAVASDYNMFPWNDMCIGQPHTQKCKMMEHHQSLWRWNKQSLWAAPDFPKHWKHPKPQTCEHWYYKHSLFCQNVSQGCSSLGSQIFSPFFNEAASQESCL